jgi:hypothetical protein
MKRQIPPKVIEGHILYISAFYSFGLTVRATVTLIRPLGPD